MAYPMNIMLLFLNMEKMLGPDLQTGLNNLKEILEREWKISDFNATNNGAVWFDIPVEDLDRAKEFYESVLNIKIFKENANGFKFCVLNHKDGNGGFLVPNKFEISSDSGILLYLNVNDRIQNAMKNAENLGAKIIEQVRGISPHGFRAIILDSEGNRIALHSNSSD